MRVALATVLALALVAIYAVGRWTEQELTGAPGAPAARLTPTKGRTVLPEARTITMAADRVTAALAPAPARMGTGLHFEQGRCAVEWRWQESAYGAGWLADVTCEPEPEATYAEPWEASWPAYLWPAIQAIDWCESRAGQHPDTYRLDLLHGGRMQIAQGTWRAYFEREYGWTWAQVVRDDAINFRAAYTIYQQSGFRAWPICGRSYY